MRRSLIKAILPACAVFVICLAAGCGRERETAPKAEVATAPPPPAIASTRPAPAKPDQPIGKLVETFKAGVLSLRPLAFSPDGKLVVVAGDDTAFLWDLRRNRARERLAGSLTLAVFSPDSRYLAATDERQDGENLIGKVKIWSVRNGRLLSTLPVDTSLLLFSPDSRRLLAGQAGNGVDIYRVPSGSVVGGVPGTASGDYETAVFSPNGRYVALAHGISNGDGAMITTNAWVDIIDAHTHRRLRRFSGFNYVEAMDFRRDSSALAVVGADDGLNDYYITLCTLRSGRTNRICYFTGDGQIHVGRAQFMAGDRLLRVETDGETRYWLVNAPHPADKPDEGSFVLRWGSLLSPDARLVAEPTDDGQAVQVWRVSVLNRGAGG